MSSSMKSSCTKVEFASSEVPTPQWIADFAAFLQPTKEPMVPPKPQRIMLLPRYSRSPDADVVFYGNRNCVKHLTQDSLVRRYLAMRGKRLAESIKNEHIFDLATGTWHPVVDSGDASNTPSKCRMNASLRRVEKQLVHVLDVWTTLADTIREGNYYSPEHTGAHGYCSNVLDVQLVDEIDILCGLDADACMLAGKEYESIFSGCVTRYSRECDCGVCDCVDRPQALQAFRRMALRYHAEVDHVLFARVFHELGIGQKRI